MKKTLKATLQNLLNANLFVSTGCTEPIAIAYAASKARELLAEEPVFITVKLSGNMAKNAMDAGVPGSKHVGAAYVSALGALFANPSKGFELLAGICEECQDKAYEFSQLNVKVEIADTSKQLYIEVVVRGASNVAKVVVCDSHTNIQCMERNGEVVYGSFNDESSTDNVHNEDTVVSFTVKDVFDFVDEMVDYSVFNKAICLNKALSDEGMSKSWGLNVGKVKPFGEDTIQSRIVSVTTAAVDARMSGAEVPAMACTGSGNQGITVTLPVYQFGKELGKTDAEIEKAVAIAVMCTIYVKKNLNVLSHLCGAVIASSGASAGMTYLLGGDYRAVEYAIKNVLASVVGMFCDGAKSTCALKVSACVNMAIHAANLAMTSSGRLTDKVGICNESLDLTIHNIAKIEKNSSKIMEETILNIMTD